jgi:hypothetical protein
LVVLYAIRSKVYLSIHCLTVEGLEFDARVVCAGGERLTLYRCPDKTATHVGVACGGVIYKQYLWGDARLCIA